MTINLSNNNPRVNYTATSGQTAFTIPFDYFDDGDISVYQNGTLKTITTHYTISGSTMTLVTGATAGDKIAITRDVPIERTTDLTSTYSAASINNQLDTIVAQIADLDDRVSRSISLNDYEVGVSLDLPATADRLGKTIQFNSSTGALEVGPSGDELTSLAGITSDITTVAGVSSDLSTVATAASNINAVGVNISKVTTVSNNISTILSLNSNISDIRDVADSITDINDVADSIDQVELVAGSISNVDTVALANSNISTVAGDINNINTVAGLSANITTVAGITGAISTVNSNAADITSVSNNIDDVNDIANVITKVTTVADNIGNVNTLSAQASNIGALAGISGSINSLGGISSDITTLAAVASEIGDSATNAASALSAKNAAEAARDATLAAYDSFDDRYLGAKSEEPTLDNDNNPLVAGSLYFDNNSNSMKLYTGSAWVAAYIAGNDYLALSGGTLTGQVNTTANITFGDNDKAIFGAGSDLQIYSDGSSSYIKESGSGNLVLNAGGLRVNSPNNNETLLKADVNGAVQLRYDNSAKLDTTSTGIAVTGNATFADNGKAIFGAGSDLQIYHDGSNSRIVDTGTGDLSLEGANVRFRSTNGDYYAYFTSNAETSLYYNNAVKLATTSTGVDITGTLTSDGLTVDGDAVISSANARLRLKETDTTDNDTQLQTTGGVFKISRLDDDNSTATQRFTIDNSTGDISFYEDTGTTAKLHWSAADESLGIGLSSASHVLDVTGDKDTWITKLYNSGSDANASGLLVRSDATAAHDASVLGVYADGGYKMMVKSSGNVGIGTSSPSESLTNRGNIFIETNSTSADSGNGLFWQSTTNGWSTLTAHAAIYGKRTDASNGYLRFDTRQSGTTQEAMRIDSSGNVGIGVVPQSGWRTSGGEKVLQIDTTSIYNNSGNDLYINSNWYLNSSAQVVYLESDFATSYSQQSGNHIWYYAASGTAGNTFSFNEAMRIDSSGNLLVGTTDTTPFNNSAGTSADFGFVVNKGGGYTSLASYNTTPLYINRTSSDGDIVNFRKDGTTVGSIGNSGTALLFENPNANSYFAFHANNQSNGIFFQDGTSKLLSAYSTRDAEFDLGASNSRWKDLYLSGGVYLGGTGAANKLDDYEEGTWTPVAYGTSTVGTATYVQQKGYYVKIGRAVHYQLYLGWSGHTGAGSLRITGLPFSSGSSANVAYSAPSVAYTNGLTFGSGNLGGYIGSNGDFIAIVMNNSNAAPTAISVDADVTELIISGMYVTA